MICVNFCIAEESSDDEEYQVKNETGKSTHNESDDNELDMETSVNWRDNLAQKARNAYLERQSNTQNLMKIVYGAINAVSGQIGFFLQMFVFFSLFSIISIVHRRKSEKNNPRQMAKVIRMMKKKLVECSMLWQANRLIYIAIKKIEMPMNLVSLKNTVRNRVTGALKRIKISSKIAL